MLSDAFSARKLPKQALDRKPERKKTTGEKIGAFLKKTGSDAINAFDEKQISIVTPEAQDIYGHMIDTYINHIYTIEEYNEYVNSIDKALYENTVLYQIVKSYTEYFDVTATTLKIFIDENGDGVADELDEASEALLKELIDAFYMLAKDNPKSAAEISGTTNVDVLAKNIITAVNANQYAPDSTISGNTIPQKLKTLVKIFNNSKIDDSVFGTYKKAGIRFQLDLNTKYTDESLTGEVATVLKKVWNKISDGTLILNNGTNAYFEYAEAINSAVTSLNAVGFNNTCYTVNELIKENNSLTKVIVAAATNTTWYRYTDTTQELIPVDRLETLVRYYKLSQIDEEKRTKEEKEFVVKNNPQTFENNYLINMIVPALTSLLSDENLQNVVYELYLTNINSHNFNFTIDKYNQECLEFMKAIYED